jgi:molybdate transport system permease protein
MGEPASTSPQRPHRPRSDLIFYGVAGILSGGYLLLIVALLIADSTFTTPRDLAAALDSREIRYAIKLSMISCTISAILSVLVAVPTGYLMSRYRFWGRNFLDAVLDIPVVLPPLVIGLSLLILFQTGAGQVVERLSSWLHEYSPPNPWNGAPLWPWDGITYEVPSVIIAQFTVACAFAVRTMRVTFDQIHPRAEQVALTLGCSRGQAFWRVVLPEARRGILTAGTLAWARSLGEFGPILVFSGATRMHTEVLPTTVFLELSGGNLEGAVAVSLIMVAAAVLVLVVARMFGLRHPPIV